MNKEKVVEELNEWAKKEFGSLYSVMDDGDLTLCKNRNSIAWFGDFEKSTFRFSSSGDDCGIQLIKEGIMERFYDKAIELMNEYGPKYTVHIIKNSEDGFLNYKSSTGEWFLSDNQQGVGLKAQFTRSEIDDMKNNENLSFDWNKAIIKEVE